MLKKFLRINFESLNLFLNPLRRQGSADRTPVVPFLLFVNVPAANCSEEIVAPSCHEKKGGSGELKRKDRQAFREWLRERLRSSTGSFRRRLNGGRQLEKEKLNDMERKK